MKKYFILFCVIVVLHCIENQIRIQAVYIRPNETSSIQNKGNLVYKELKVCEKNLTPLRPGGENDDLYDKKIVDLLNEAFGLSKNNAWFNVELYNDKKSCKVLKGYYYE